MERAFIVTSESEYFKDYAKFLEKNEEQRAFINKFFNEKGIDGNTYIVGGNGMMNVPFSESDKSEIGLRVESTEINLSKFGKMLCKEDQNGLCAFKKSSKIAKEFADKCVDLRIPINLYSPRVGDYFASLRHGIYGCSSERFLLDDIIYLKIISEYITADETPEGFTEIKLSEYHKIAESMKENE